MNLWLHTRLHPLHEGMFECGKLVQPCKPWQNLRIHGESQSINIDATQLIVLALHAIVYLLGLAPIAD